MHAQTLAHVEAVTPTTTVKFHFSLWVIDLNRTVAFYRALFGQEPHKHYPDYAKFELDQPPVVLSFLQQPAPRGASLNHAGLRLPNSAGLVAVQRRLEQAGYATLREEGVECCYAFQTKFWATDPDGVRWEVYAVHGDIGHHGKGRAPLPAPAPRVEVAPSDGTWTHTLPDAFPDRLPFPDASLDEVKLMGTINAAGGAAELDRALAEVARVLRPGGRVFVRGLVGDRPYPGTPDFPGLLTKIRHVPNQSEPLDALARAGFRGVEVETWKEVGCLSDASGVGFRSLTATARKVRNDGAATAPVRYDGPFASLTDDDGLVFPRGAVVAVTPDQAERLRNGPAGGQFTFLASAT